MHRLCFAVLALLSFTLAASAAGDSWDHLKQGNAVALVRHAEAPGGAGDPAGFKLDDCATQRNLSEQGRAQATALGQRLRDHRIPIGRVLTSQWCRCRETARLMSVGDATDAPTFNNAFVLSEQRGALTDGALKVISDWNGPGVLLVVTHGANILALTGAQPREAEMVVVAPPGPGDERRVRVLARIPPG